MHLRSSNLASPTKIAVILALLASTLIPSAAFAKDVYRGQNYTVSIGDDGSYYGCDARKRCLFIESYSHRERGTYTWENKGFTYIMSPIYGTQSTSDGANYQYSLKVINPHGKIILKRILNPIGLGG
jgi:hypothetical protein